MSVGSTNVNIFHVEKAFREYYKDENLTVKNADSVTIAVGHGFTSNIVRVTLTWSDDSIRHRPDLPASVVVKAPAKAAVDAMFEKFGLSDSANPQDTQAAEVEKSKIADMFMDIAHKTECAIYRMFEKGGPIPLPGCYAIWDGVDQSPDRPAMILLEDLCQRAMVLGDGSKTLSLEQLKSLVDALAELHIWSLTTDTKWREQLETYDARIAMFAQMIEMFKANLERTKNAYPEMYGCIDNEKVFKMFEPERVLERVKRIGSHMLEVLVHGDFWANNVMFSKAPDGTMSSDIVAIIDWQMALKGHGMIDVGRVISMCVDPQICHDNLEELLRGYYEKLTKKFGADGILKEMTFDRLYQVAREEIAVGYLMSIVMQDMMLIMFASGDTPEAEVKRQRLLDRCKRGFEFATQILDIKKDTA